MGLLNYKTLVQGDLTSKNALSDPNNPKKWGGQAELSPILKEYLVFKVAEDLNLDELHTFELIDQYFLSNEKAGNNFKYLHSINQRLDQIKNEITNQLVLGPNTPLYYNQRNQIKEQLEREVIKQINEIKKEVYFYYFEERKSLLKAIYLTLQSNLALEKKIKINLLSQLNLQELSENLIKGLEQTQKFLPNLEQFEKDICRSCVISLLQEEVQTWQILFYIYHHYVVPTPSQLYRILKYQVDLNFRGYLEKNNFIVHVFGNDREFKQLIQLISDFQILNSLNAIQIHLFTEEGIDSNKTQKFVQGLFQNPDHFSQTQNLLDQIKLDLNTVPVYIAFRQVLWIIKKLDLVTAFKIGVGKESLIKMDLNRRVDKIKKSFILDKMSSIIEAHKHIDEEIFDKGGELLFLIQDWICLIFPFLKEQGLEQFMNQAQILTFEILKNKTHLNKIWKQIQGRSGSEIIGLNLKNELKQKVIYKTLDIFEEILVDPIVNLDSFVQLMFLICGNKKPITYELMVLSLMQDVKLSQITREFLGHQEQSLLSYIIQKFNTYSQLVAKNNLSERDFNLFSNICCLLCKIVQLNALLYEQINYEVKYIQADELSDINMGVLDRKRGTFEQTADIVKYDPFITMIFSALYDLYSWNNIEDAVRPVKYLLGAITSIYRNLNLQCEIIALIESQYDSSLSYTFINYMGFVLDSHERNIEYLRPEEKRIDLHLTILGQSLTQFYQSLLKNYFILEFQDNKSFFQFSSQLLKLTNTLLEKYLDVNPSYRIPIAHKLPQFDTLLQILNNILNSCQPENIAFKFLLLEEQLIEGMPSGVQNKFILQTLRKEQDKGFQILVQKTIMHSLSLYNTLLDLCQQNLVYQKMTPDQQGTVNARTYYVTNLNSVQSFSNFITNPGAGPTFEIKRVNEGVMSYSFMNIIQYYVMPSHSFLANNLDIKTKAIQFFNKCTRIWGSALHYTQKVSLESLLRATGLNFSMVKAQYGQNLIDCFRQITDIRPLQYLSSFLSLLITCTGSQQAFIEDLFKDSQFSTQMFEMVKFKLNLESNDGNIVIDLSRDVMARIVILLSEMNRNKICKEFIKQLIDNDIIKQLSANVVRPLIQIINRSLNIERSQKKRDFGQYNSLRGVDSDQYSSQEVYSQCLALITLKYYLRFISDLYSSYSDNQTVRNAVASVFQEQVILNLQMPIGSYANSIFQDLKELNEEIVKNESLRDTTMGAYYNAAAQNQQISPQHILFMENSKILTSDCFVELQKIDGPESYARLKQIELYYLLSFSSIDTRLCYGELGSQFLININELKSTMKNYFYNPRDAIRTLSAQAATFNLLASYLLSYNSALDGIKSFFLSIGQTRAGENIRKKEFAQKDRVVNSSLFPLIESRDPCEIIKNEEAVKGVQLSLTRLLIEIAKPLITVQEALTERGQFYFQTKTQETNLDYLTIILGSINTLSTINPFSEESMKQLDKVNDLVQILPLIKYHYDYEDIGHSQNKERKYSSSSLFVNLALQTFSICNMISQEREKQLKNRDIVVVADHSQGMQYIQILGQIVQIMQDDCCFQEGMQILELSLQIVSNENMLAFLKRSGEISVSRLILRKTHSSTSTFSEQIQIIKFLIALAQTEGGAQLIIKENIFQSISSSQLLIQVNQEELYQDAHANPRNLTHIYWCYFLLFLRVLNSQFGTDPDFKPLVSIQMKFLQSRIISVLEFAAEKNRSKHQLSLALLEEMDLLTGVFTQIFAFTDQFDAQEMQIFQQVKNCYLYTAIFLFQSDETIRPTSAIERYLSTIDSDKIKENLISLTAGFTSLNGLDLICLVQKIQTFLNINNSLLSMLLIEKKSGIDVLAFGQNLRDYENLSYAGSVMTVMTRGYPYGGEDYLGLELIQTAIHNYLSSLQFMSTLVKGWVRQENHLSHLFRDSFSIFRNDESIMSEYAGLNHFIGSLTFDEASEQLEASMQIGFLVTTLMMERSSNLQRYQESVWGSRGHSYYKELMDAGDACKQLYLEFFTSLKESKIISLSIPQFHPMMSKVVDHIKKAPLIEDF